MLNVTKKEKENRSMSRYEPQLSPFSLLDRFLDDSFFDPFNIMTPSLMRNRGLASMSTSFPKIDVSENESEIKVVANVPGIDPNNLDIEVGDDYLALSGKIDKETSNEKNGKVYRLEREYGEFRREFSLPARVNKDGIVAKAKNGVLSITLPKSEDERRTKVKVQVDN